MLANCCKTLTQTFIMWAVPMLTYSFGVVTWNGTDLENAYLSGRNQLAKILCGIRISRKYCFICRPIILIDVAVILTSNLKQIEEHKKSK